MAKIFFAKEKMRSILRRLTSSINIFPYIQTKDQIHNHILKNIINHITLQY